MHYAKADSCPHLYAFPLDFEMVAMYDVLVITMSHGPILDEFNLVDDRKAAE